MTLVLPNNFNLKMVVEPTDEAYTIKNGIEYRMTAQQMVTYLESQITSSNLPIKNYSDYPSRTELNRTFMGKQVYETVITINNIENIRQNPAAMPIINIDYEFIISINIILFGIAPALVEQSFSYVERDDISVSPSKQIYCIFDKNNGLIIDFNNTNAIYQNGEGLRIIVQYTQN